MIKTQKFYTVLLLTTLLLMTAGVAYAEDPAPAAGDTPSVAGPQGGGPRNFGQGGCQGGGQGGGQDGCQGKGQGKMFAEADANEDGFLSKAELQAQQEKRFNEMFAKADTNNDGKLSPEEAQKGREMIRAKFKERMGQFREKGGAGGAGGGGFKKRQGLGAQETE
ncbi:MAG: EF-hand domain-containing protein [Pseudobdellovibrionaceae bacterium]